MCTTLRYGPSSLTELRDCLDEALEKGYIDRAEFDDFDAAVNSAIKDCEWIASIPSKHPNAKGALEVRAEGPHKAREHQAPQHLSTPAPVHRCTRALVHSCTVRLLFYERVLPDLGGDGDESAKFGLNARDVWRRRDPAQPHPAPSTQPPCPRALLPFKVLARDP